MTPARNRSGSKQEGGPYDKPFTPKISLADTDGKNAVFTIASVSFRNFAPKGRTEENKIVLTYRELSDREHVINKTGYLTLVEKIGQPGDLTNQAYGSVVNCPWVGKKVAVGPVTVQNPETGQNVDKLDVCPPERWDKVMEAARNAQK